MSGAATDVAIIGMVGRFPGATNLEEFWRNVRGGVESITRRSDEELAALGVPEEIRRMPGFVSAVAALDQVETFDAGFFSITPGEAEILDPQHRLLLECAWSALEQAGYDPDVTRGTIGVFAGTSMSSYLGNLTRHPDVSRSFSPLQLMIANDKDHVAMRLAYKLNLKGPAVCVQSACSTSLVAVHLSCEALLSHQCDLALAAGVTARVSPTGSQPRGYWHFEGDVTSADGYCRPFDAGANGTIFGNGIGVVVLKRLKDALADGDFVHAVIKGSAVNNDGSARVGYTAPSVDGQAAVIAEALAVSGVEPESIGYIEAHGTGTPLGDPIEFSALQRAFRKHTAARGFCALGSVKANVGHLETAAGMAGLMKAVLTLRHREIPPHLHFSKANPNINVPESPFYVPTTLTPWPEGKTPRRAGVSSFGMGGTNAHLVLEEAPARPAHDGQARPWHLLQLSARSETALDRHTDQIAAALGGPLDGDLADVAHTLHAGRRHFPYRRFVVGRDPADARAALQSRDANRVRDAQHDGKKPAIAFMFPGQGAQYIDMARELYATEPLFRDQVDRAAIGLLPHLRRDIRTLIFCTGDRAAAERALAETSITQPALFVIEHALARLLMAWGVTPDALIGHSLGELVAATLAGVFKDDDALALVAARGRIIQQLPRGAMLAIALPEGEIAPLLEPRVAMAAVNGPSACVVSGPADAIDVLELQLGARGIGLRRLNSSHAFHSSMLDAAVAPFAECVAAVRRAAPSIKWISNVTGTWITDADAVDPAYWGRHLRQPVRFADGVRKLAEDPNRVLLEVGPGQALSGLARRQHTRVIPTMRASHESGSDAAALLTALGKLWLAGAPIKNPQPQRRVPLPTYPFERRRYWIVPPSAAPVGATASAADAKHESTTEPAAAMRPSGSPGATSAAVVDASGALDAVQTVTAIWQELLGVDRIDPGAHFYELGGDSVLATQMASRIRERCRVPLPLEAVLIEPTVEAIVRRIQALAAGDRPDALRPQPVDRNGPLPLSFAQQRLFFLHQLAPDSPFYNVPVAVRVTGVFHVDALVRALDAIVGRHEILRTTLALEDGEPRQRVRASAPSDVRLLDVAAEPERVREQRAAAAISAAVRDGFDLGAGPLVRLAVVRTGPEVHHVAIVLHHIVCDAWSIGIFLRELAALYHGDVNDGPISLPPLLLQYGDVAVHERRRFEGERLQTELDYWTGRLAGATPLRLRGERTVPDDSTSRGGVEGLRLGADVAAALKQLARDESETLFTLLLSIFLIVLHHHSGQDDIVVGTDVANRHERATEELIGFFINQLVLRTDLSGNPTFRELARRVHDTSVQAFAHQELPFDRVVEALNPVRDARGTPLFNVKFVLQNAPAPRLELPGLTLAPLTSDTGAAKFDLLFNLEDTGGDIAGQLEYNADRFSAATIGHLLRQFEVVARAVAANPDLRPTDLEASLLATERQNPARQLIELQRQMPLPGARRRGVGVPVETSRG
jgi:acyl transferase domain-containing protein